MRALSLAGAAVAALCLAGCAPSSPLADEAGAGRLCAVSSVSGWSESAPSSGFGAALERTADSVGASTDYVEGGSGLSAALEKGCALVIGVDSATAEFASAAAREHPGVRFALVGASFVDGSGNPTTPSNGRVIDVRASEAAYLAGIAAAGQTTTGRVGTLGGSADALTQSMMDAFAQGVSAYDLAHGSSVEVAGWDLVSATGTLADPAGSADGVDAAAKGLLDEGADIVFPVAGAASSGAATAIAASGRAEARLIWADATAADYETATLGASQSGAQSGGSGQSGDSTRTGESAQSADAAESGVATGAAPTPALSDAALAAIGAPVLTGVVIDWDRILTDLVSADAPARLVYRLGSGVELAGFGVFAPMLAPDLVDQLDAARADIASGALVIATPFDLEEDR